MFGSGFRLDVLAKPVDLTLNPEDTVTIAAEEDAAVHAGAVVEIQRVTAEVGERRSEFDADALGRRRRCGTNEHQHDENKETSEYP